MSVSQLLEKAREAQGVIEAQALEAKAEAWEREQEHLFRVERIANDPESLGFRKVRFSNDLIPGKTLELPEGGLSEALRVQPVPTVKVMVTAWSLAPLEMPASWRSPWAWPRWHLFVTFRYPDETEVTLPMRDIVQGTVGTFWVRLEVAS